jgi:hypothetical protein
VGRLLLRESVGEGTGLGDAELYGALTLAAGAALRELELLPPRGSRAVALGQALLLEAALGESAAHWTARAVLGVLGAARLASGSGAVGTAGYVNGYGTAAALNGPNSISWDAAASARGGGRIHRRL